MILNPMEIMFIKPALTLLECSPAAEVAVTVTVPGGRTLRIEASEAGLAIKATFPDSAPAMEFYRNAMGLAQAYGLSLVRITPKS